MAARSSGKPAPEEDKAFWRPNPEGRAGGIAENEMLRYHECLEQTERANAYGSTRFSSRGYGEGTRKIKRAKKNAFRHLRTVIRKRREARSWFYGAQNFTALE
jgi:hypothetical protein